MLGHESLAVVERDGDGFARGDLVCATVRRSCHHCLACAEGAPDSCLTGDYSERGITRLDGFARELVRGGSCGSSSRPPLPRAPRRARRADVGLRARRCATRSRSAGGSRGSFERALVTGAGAVGLLTTMLLRLEGVEVWTASLEPANASRRGARRALRLDAATADLDGARRLRPRRRGGGRRAADGRHASACCGEAASRACSGSTAGTRRSSSTAA